MMRSVLSCCIVLLCATAALAQPPEPIKLTLTPAKPPTPALRYQFLPDSRILVSGDAAPIYKQVIPILEKLDNQKKLQIHAWADMPLDQLPKEEVRKQLAELDEVFKLLDKAARCDHCEWGLLDRLRTRASRRCCRKCKKCAIAPSC